jgi:hypothetical protein
MAQKVRIVSGFVVGSTPPSFFSDGSTYSRPKLLEHEMVGGLLHLTIGTETIRLDHEQVGALKGVLDSCMDEVL